MSSAPPNGKAPGATAGLNRAGAAGGRAPASSGSSVDKPKPGAKPQMTAEQRHQMMVVCIALGVVLVVGVGVYGYFNWRTPSGPPRLNDDVTRLAHFTATTDFDLLPIDRQRLYMKNLQDRKKELEEQFKAGKIPRHQYEDALAIVWIGKQFKRVDHYQGLGELDKKYYLDELLDKEAAEDAKEEAQADDVKRDKEKVKAIVQRFPAKDRHDYETFRDALKERAKEREKAAKAAAKAARQATRPTSRPAEPPK
jgi:hypothetical protein